MKREDLPDILYNIIKSFPNGSATMQQIFRRFWNLYKKKLNEADDIFYTWNYEIRWAATELRKQGRMKPAHSRENTRGGEDTSRIGIWEIW